MKSTAPPASRRILIMGGTGTVGSHLMRELLPDRAEFDIIGAAHTPASATRLQTAGYASVRFDLERLETLLPAMQGVDTLFMLKPYSIDYLIQSKRVIDAAVKAGVKHIVNLGSFGADDTPWSSIGWNRLVEAYLRVSGLGFTTLRPNFFMDNVPARTDVKTGQIVHYFGATSVSWIAAQDIARVAAAVLRRPKEFHGHALSLATEARSMDSIADLLTRHLGRPFVAEYVPAHEALPQLLSRGWQEAFARPFVDYMTAISAGEVREVGDTTRTVEDVTGSPAIDWQAFIAKNHDRFTGAT